MRNFARVSLVMAGSAALVGSMALPASAVDTTTTVTVTGGTIYITAPLGGAGSIAPGETADIGLENIQVTDERAGTAAWVATATLAAFTGESADSMAQVATTYAAETAVLTGAPTLAPVPEEVVLTVGTSAAVQTTTAVLGNNTAIWNAVLSVTAPNQALAGEYEATLTHSVS